MVWIISGMALLAGLAALFYAATNSIKMKANQETMTKNFKEEIQALKESLEQKVEDLEETVTDLQNDVDPIVESHANFVEKLSATQRQNDGSHDELGSS